MRKAGIVIGFVAFTIATALVTSVETQGGAVVINDFNCTLWDADGDLTQFTTDSHSVVTGSTGSMIWCKASGVPNTTGRAVQLDFDSTGIYCRTMAGLTQRWHETISASGEAMLRCFRP